MKPKVLIVEDERAVADAIAYALETDGCVPLRVETGERAREALLAHDDVALVVLDVGLPDVNGLDLCREIRAARDIPVIFLTARAEEVDRVAGLEIGADDYVTKPFSPRELSARVRAVLRRARRRETVGHSEGSPATSALPFEIDEPRRAIRYFGQVLSLTATEYRLLQLFARHPGRVYSRDELLEGLWDDPGATTDRAVDSHVKALRAKLHAVRADVDAIETRRGEGYALREQW